MLLERNAPLLKYGLKRKRNKIIMTKQISN